MAWQAHPLDMMDIDTEDVVAAVRELRGAERGIEEEESNEFQMMLESWNEREDSEIVVVVGERTTILCWRRIYETPVADEI